MIIARIIRSDCNLIELGKGWLPIKHLKTTLITEQCIRRNSTSRFQSSSLYDLKINHFTLQSGNRQN